MINLFVILIHSIFKFNIISDSENENNENEQTFISDELVVKENIANTNDYSVKKFIGKEIKQIYKDDFYLLIKFTDDTMIKIIGSKDSTYNFLHINELPDEDFNENRKNAKIRDAGWW